MSRSKKYTKQEVVKAIKTVSKNTDGPPTVKQFRQSDEIEPSFGAVRNLFKTWHNAKDFAGVDEVSREKPQHQCDYCSEKFRRSESALTDGRKFCDFECYGAFKSKNTNGEDLPWYEGEKHTENCAQCGDEITVYGSLRKEQENNFCDHECYGLFERTDNDRPYYGPKWKMQRRKALKESDGVCIFDGCEKTESNNGRSLDLHHIIPLSEFDSYDKANKPSNLVPVCAEHHGKIENKPPEYFD